MTSFQDAPDENIEHDEKMELRSSLQSTPLDRMNQVHSGIIWKIRVFL